MKALRRIGLGILGLLVFAIFGILSPPVWAPFDTVIGPNTGIGVHTTNGVQIAAILVDGISISPYGMTGSCGPDGNCATPEWPPAYPLSGTIAVNGAGGCPNRTMLYDAGEWTCLGPRMCPVECQ